MIKQEYIYFDPQNPEFCKKMVAKYGEDWHIDDFHNDTLVHLTHLESYQTFQVCFCHFDS